MCYNGKCMCLQVETGALIWAILSTFSMGLKMLSSIALLMSFNMLMEKLGYSNDSDKVTFFGGIAIAVTLWAIMEFTFSVLLLVGVNKRRGGYVKAYFVYGVIRTVIALAIVTVLLIVLYHDDFADKLLPIFITIYVLIGGGNGLILHMIRMTYNKFNSVPVKNRNLHMMS